VIIKAGNRRTLHDEDLNVPSTLLRIGIVATQLVKGCVVRDWQQEEV
jgi:hypothetical protein